MTCKTSMKCETGRIHAKKRYSSGFIMIYTVTVSLFGLTPRLWEAPSDRRRTDSTGIAPIRCPTSLPATFSRSDGDWSGVSLSSARVIAMIGATHSSQLSAAALRAEFVPDA